MKPAALMLLAVLPLAACAHGRQPTAEAPLAPEPANDRVLMYAGCASAATQAGTVQRFGRYIRFTCTGEPAHALFAAAEVFAHTRGQEVTAGARITRLFSPRAWDDQCWSEAGAYACRLHMPVGAFLYPERDTQAPDHGRKKGRG